MALSPIGLSTLGRRVLEREQNRAGGAVRGDWVGRVGDHGRCLIGSLPYHTEHVPFCKGGGGNVRENAHRWGCWGLKLGLGARISARSGRGQWPDRAPPARVVCRVC